MTSGFILLAGLTGLLAILAVASWNAQRRTRAQVAALARVDLAAPLRAELGQLRLELGTQLHQMRESSDAQAGQTIHVILEATDNGTPSLTRYQRVIVTIQPH